MTTFMFMLIALFFGGLTVISCLCGADHEPGIDHDADGGHAEAGSGLGAWFSIRVISIFGTAFGTVGAICKSNGVGFAWTMTWAVASAVILAGLIKILMDYLRRQEGGGTFSREQLLNVTGTVIMPIMEGAIGEAQFIVAGQNVNVPAQSVDGKAILQGEQVVVSKIGPVVLVDRVGK